MTNIKDAMSTALIVEGGAMRGIFSAGVLDAFMTASFNPFNLFFGVSAGSAVIASFLSNRPCRMRQVFTDYSGRSEFISVSRFLKGGHLLDLDWLWEITLRELPLDYDAIFRKDIRFLISITSVNSGVAIFKEPQPHDLIDLIKASCSIPILYRIYPSINGEPMADGGIADPIPIQKAIAAGAKRIVVVRSRHSSYIKRSSFAGGLAAWCTLRKHPALREGLSLRAHRYNEALRIIRNPPSDVEVIEICPPLGFVVGRLGKDSAQLDEGYSMGLRAGEDLLKGWGQPPPPPALIDGEVNDAKTFRSR